MKNNFICKCKKTVSGVTLIALIVTVIVALILAGVGIVTLTSKDEVIEKSKLAKEKIEGYTETEGDMIKDTLKYPNSSDCKHKNTEKRNATGTFSGDTYCLDCGVLLATGTIQPCETHPTTTITEAVAATCCSKGNTGNTICTVCGFVVTPGTEIAINPSNHVGGTEVRNKTNVYTGDTYCLGCGVLLSAGTAIIDHNGTYIPIGATFYDKSEDITLVAGDPFPEKNTKGDIYKYEDYEYHYCEWYNGSIWQNGTTTSNVASDGWGVKVISTTKSSYSNLIAKINGSPIESLSSCWENCNYLVDASNITIPSTVINMLWSFYSCDRLTTAPIIPSKVSNMKGTFRYCTKLKGTVTVNANPSTYSDCFNNTSLGITISGTCTSTTKSRLAGTASSGNVTY